MLCSLLFAAGKRENEGDTREEKREAERTASKGASPEITVEEEELRRCLERRKRIKKILGS